MSESEIVTGSFHAPRRAYKTCLCRFCRDQSRGARKPFRARANRATRRLGRALLGALDYQDPCADASRMTIGADYWD